MERTTVLGGFAFLQSLVLRCSHGFSGCGIGFSRSCGAADMIHVMTNGDIVESVTYDDLISRGGAFAILSKQR